MKLVSLLLGSIAVSTTLAVITSPARPPAPPPSPAPSPSPSPSPSPTPTTPGPPFVAGGVCANYTKGAQKLDLVLSGKHLIVGEFEWPLWSEYNGSGWSGIDITILDRVAEILNFTYQIKPLGFATRATPSAKYTIYSAKCDLVLSSWEAQPARIENSTMLRGHIDTSRYLVATKPTVKQASFVDHLETVFKPFTYRLWGTVFAVIVCSGLVMYVLEKDSDPYDFDGDHAWFHSQFLSFGMFTGCLLGYERATELAGVGFRCSMLHPQNCTCAFFSSVPWVLYSGN